MTGDGATKARESLPAHSVWAEVSLGALRHNLRQVVGSLRPGTRVMAVVKADAYGHGLVEAAAAFGAEGATHVGVSTIEEGLALRKAGVEVPVLCFAPPLSAQLGEVAAHRLSVTVHQAEQLEPLRRAARLGRTTVRCHVKVDTGMGRLGATAEETVDLVRKAAQHPEINLEGVYTHFATAQEKDSAPFFEQWFRFRDVLRELDRTGLDVGLRHCANSAALLRLPECQLDMVRPGTVLYGDWPAPFPARPNLALVSALRLCTRLVAIRDLPAGATVGYGRQWRAIRPSRVGVIPVGWADGLSMAPNARPPSLGGALVRAARELWSARHRCVLVGDEQAPILGRVGMQLTSLDLTDLPDARVGDVVTVPCRKTAVPSRIQRVYLDTQTAAAG